MADSRDIGGGRMNIRTNRIGVLAIHANAPVVSGEISDSRLEFTVRIDQVATGNPLLDPELHALIHQITGGTLSFTGTRDGDTFSGHASAGNIEVPLELVPGGSVDGELVVAGKSQFTDVHIPLPGLGHIRHLEVDIDGRLHLD